MNDINNSAVNSLRFLWFCLFRVAGVPPPPVLHTVTNNYKTPYDAAYYYYGTRNPLDPNLPYNQSTVFQPSLFCFCLFVFYFKSHQYILHYCEPFLAVVFLHCVLPTYQMDTGLHSFQCGMNIVTLCIKAVMMSTVMAQWLFGGRKTMKNLK